jgi:transcription initiation factor TFIID subunit 2
MQAADEITSYSGLSIASVSILYQKKVLDVVQSSRVALAHAVAQQFFGCFVHAQHWLDLWLLRSLAK